MITLTMLLQAAQGAASAAGQQPAGGSTWGFWLMILLMFAVMYFFMIRPQRKQQKEQENFRAGLKKGDKVVTAGGIYGTIAEVQENSVLIKVDGETKLRVSKNAIQKDYTESQQ